MTMYLSFNGVLSLGTCLVKDWISGHTLRRLNTVRPIILTKTSFLMTFYLKH